MQEPRRPQIKTAHSSSSSGMSHIQPYPMTKPPLNKSISQESTSSDGHIRKRVCKACDRCRLKKSKCDGASPCSRCKADNAICVFGERKKSHDKIYPKGYVEVLEQQQTQLVSGIQAMYRKLLASGNWEGDALPETNGFPLTHHMLAALGILAPKDDGSGEVEPFEEDCSVIQDNLLAKGSGYAQRRQSVDSESEQDHPAPSRNDSQDSKPTLFKENYNFPSSTSSPINHKPVPRALQTRPSFVGQMPLPQFQYANDHSQGFSGVPPLQQWDQPSMMQQPSYTMHMTGIQQYQGADGQWNQFQDQLFMQTEAQFDPNPRFNDWDTQPPVSQFEAAMADTELDKLDGMT